MPNTTLQSKPVFIDGGTAFSVTASAPELLSYQWQFNGQDLFGETNRTFSIAAAQPKDEGDYTVIARTSMGAVTSAPPAYLYVVPTDQTLKANFTNQAGVRLPYFYELPIAYDPSRKYPLVCVFTDVDEVFWESKVQPYPNLHVFNSYRSQATDPTIVVWPCFRAGDHYWTDAYLRQADELMDELLAKFSVETNRIYLEGSSTEGVHAVWDSLARRTNFYAAGRMFSGSAGNASANAIKEIPVWATAGVAEYGLSGSRELIRRLRQAGGQPIYTEYVSGAHLDCIYASMWMPAAKEWLLAQRRGLKSTAQPLLSIVQPQRDSSYRTGAAALDLTVRAAAPDQPVTGMIWTNLTAKTGGQVSGTNTWSVTGIPLLAEVTNVIVVTATTISWVPAYGGQTTLCDTLQVFASPIRATLTRQGPGIELRWTGGAPPFRIQQATDLSGQHWKDIASNTVSPLELPFSDPVAAFYRIIGQ